MLGPRSGIWAGRFPRGLEAVFDRVEWWTALPSCALPGPSPPSFQACANVQSSVPDVDRNDMTNLGVPMRITGFWGSHGYCSLFLRQSHLNQSFVPKAKRTWKKTHHYMLQFLTAQVYPGWDRFGLGSEPYPEHRPYDSDPFSSFPVYCGLSQGKGCSIMRTCFSARALLMVLQQSRAVPFATMTIGWQCHPKRRQRKMCKWSSFNVISM